MKTKTKHKTAYSEAVKAHMAAKRRYEENALPVDHPVKRQLYLRVVKAWEAVIALGVKFNVSRSA